MKKIISLLILLTGFISFSQSMESLKTATAKLYEANYLMDFGDIASFSYPKMVETIGQETFLEKTEKHYENDEYRLRLQLQIVPFQYGAIKKIEGKTFCVVTCRNPMRYFFENKLTSETAAEKEAWLKQVNTTKEVTFEPKRNSFNVKKISTLIAVADETTANQWKFFNFDDAMQYESFQSLFGESLKKELGL